jgi:glycosyltransferase involved in cell wall biosynthesis
MIKDNFDDLISVIIPTYNRASIIVDTLNSVKEQNYRPIELLIIDDGSDDNTEDVVSNWEKVNNEALLLIKYIKTTNAGAPIARNIGIERSTGTLIHFLDSDDLFLPFCLEEKFKALKNSEAAYAYGFSIITDMSGEKIGKHGISPSRDNNQAYIIPYTFNTSGPLIRKGVFDKIGLWNNELNGCQEIEFFFRLKKDIGAGLCVPKFLHQVRIHGIGSISQNPSKKHALSALKVLSIMVDFLPEIKKESKAAHYKNETEALSTFAVDVAIKNYKSDYLNNSLCALQIAKKYTHKIPKKIIFSLIQLIAFFSASSGLAFMHKLREG